jgi:adenylate kinase
MTLKKAMLVAAVAGAGASITSGDAMGMSPEAQLQVQDYTKLKLELEEVKKEVKNNIMKFTNLDNNSGKSDFPDSDLSTSYPALA